jgi:hypothetical protein
MIRQFLDIRRGRHVMLEPGARASIARSDRVQHTALDRVPREFPQEPVNVLSAETV